MTGDLIPWLGAQLDEDERVARATERTSSGLWHADSRGGLRASDGIGVIPESARMVPADLEHMARHDPARVLAEVDAKRRILELHESSHECSTIERWVDYEGKPVEEINNCTWVLDGDCSTVRLLTLPFVDRPGYREEWRP